MMRSILLTALLTLTLGASPASASPVAADAKLEQEMRQQSIAVPLPVLENGGGISVQYERQRSPQESWALALGVASLARSDYQSLTITGGGEFRWYLSGRALFSSLRESLAGSFVALRFDAGIASVSTASGRRLGRTLLTEPSARIGYRFLIADRVTIEPSLGLGIRADIDLTGRLSPFYSAAASMTIAAGWLW